MNIQCVALSVALAMAPLAAAPVGAPELDLKRIFRESGHLLRDREPEMTPEEYALYEKVVSTLASNPTFALKLLEAMISEQEPPSPAFAFILGNAYYAAGQTDRAEASFRGAVQRYPSFLRAWSNLGVLYYSSDRLAEAIPCFAKSLVLGDRDPTTFGLLGFCLERTGQSVPAEMAYLQAVAGDPANPSWMEGLSRIYLQGRQHGRAESLLKNLLRVKPQEPRYWLAYANVLLETSRRLEATALLETAAGTGVAGIDELSLLADLYADQKLLPEALATCRRLGTLAPVLGEQRMLRLAQGLVADGQVDQARTVIDSLPADLSPAGRLAMLQTRSDCYAAEQKWPDARRELQQLLELAPRNGVALLSLGVAFAAEGNLPRATVAFESARGLPDSAYRANLELANLEIKNRQFDRGAGHLEAALKIQPSGPVEDLLVRVRNLAAQPNE